MFKIENDIVYSIQYVDRSNWIATKNPVMDKDTFVECFKKWITPGAKTEETRGPAEWVDTDTIYNYKKCNNCNYFAQKRYNYCPKCGSKMKNGAMDE